MLFVSLGIGEMVRAEVQLGAYFTDGTCLFRVLDLYGDGVNLRVLAENAVTLACRQLGVVMMRSCRPVTPASDADTAAWLTARF